MTFMGVITFLFRLCFDDGRRFEAERSECTLAETFFASATTMEDEANKILAGSRRDLEANSPQDLERHSGH